MNTRPITVAWVVPTREPVDLDTRRADLGEPVKWRDTYVAKACLWALNGSEDDLKAAHAFAAKPDHDYTVEVMQWDRDYPDLLDRAKAHALVAAQAFQGSPLSPNPPQGESTRPLPEPEPYEPPTFVEPDLRGFDFGYTGPPNRAQRRASQRAKRRSS